MRPKKKRKVVKRKEPGKGQRIINAYSELPDDFSNLKNGHIIFLYTECDTKAAVLRCLQAKRIQVTLSRLTSLLKRSILKYRHLSRESDENMFKDICDEAFHDFQPVPEESVAIPLQASTQSPDEAGTSGRPITPPPQAVLPTTPTTSRTSSPPTTLTTTTSPPAPLSATLRSLKRKGLLTPVKVRLHKRTEYLKERNRELQRKLSDSKSRKRFAEKVKNNHLKQKVERLQMQLKHSQDTKDRKIKRLELKQMTMINRAKYDRLKVQYEEAIAKTKQRDVQIQELQNEYLKLEEVIAERQETTRDCRRDELESQQLRNVNQPIITAMVRPLAYICAVKIVSNYQMTKEAVASIPQELFEILLAASIRCGQSPSTKLLVSSWPYQVLNLQNVMTCGREDEVLLGAVDKNIMVTVLSAIARSSDCQAKVVDLRNVVLSCSETRSCIQAMLSGLKLRARPFGYSIPCKVIFDWTVGAENFHNVAKAMELFSGKRRPLELLCGKAKAEGLSQDRLVKLISFLNSDVAQGLDLSLNSLGNDGAKSVLPHLKRLKKLKSLDLSYNVFDLSRDRDGSVCKLLNDVFSSLPSLQDVSLKFNRITGRLLEIVGALQSPVRVLRLDSCFLSAGDLSFLANTMNTSNLEVLDLSGNTLTSCIQSLENLLLRSCHSLVDLNLDGTSLADHELSLNMLKKAARSLKDLRYFSMQHNGFSREDKVEIVAAFASSVRTMLLKITDVRDAQGWDESDEAYNLALAIGGVPCDLSQYQQAVENVDADTSNFHLEVRCAETGDVFVDHKE